MRALAITSLFVLLVVVVALGVWIVREGFVDAPVPAEGSGANNGTCATGCQTANGCLTTLIPDTQGNMLPAVACESDPNVTEDECNSCKHCQWCDATQKCVSKALFPLLCPASAAPAAPMPAPAGSVPILGPGGAQMDPTSAEPSASAGGLLGPGGMQNRLPATDAAAQAASDAGMKGSAAALLRDIQQIVRNEVLQTRGMTTANAQPLFQAASKGNALVSEDPSLQQGAEHCNSRPKVCPKDMSQYIRKDQIPCWGCTVDY
jgi:hypothetical protein